MANMKTLTVNGITYTVDDPDAVSYGAQQELTEAQKQQARDNIGAVSREQMEKAIADADTVHEVFLYCNENTGGQIECDTTYAQLKEWLWNEEFIRAFLCYDLDGKTHYAFTSTVYHNGEDFDILFDFAGLGTAWLDHNNACLWQDNDFVTKEQLDAAVKDVIDKTCPAFSKSGTVVTCEPVEGYPLTVTAEDATYITRCGKNLLGYEDFSGATASANTQSCEGGVFTKTFTGDLSTTWLLTTACDAYRKELTIPPGTYIFSMNIVERYTSNVNEKMTGMYATVKLEDGSTVTLPDGEPVTLTQAGTVTQLRVTEGNFKKGSYIKFTLQLEAGEEATPHETYKNAETFPTRKTIPALPGVNTIWADAGQVTVTGRADPAAIIEKLTNAIGL